MRNTSVDAQPAAFAEPSDIPHDAGVSTQDGPRAVVAEPVFDYSVKMSGAQTAGGQQWWRWPSTALGLLLIVAAIGGLPWLLRRWSVSAKPNEPRIEVAWGDSAKLRPKMMALPPGEFRMGSQKFGDELPAHPVTIRRAFALSETEVTQGQYQAVVGENPSHFKDQPGWEQRPVERVSWLDAVKYCNKLSEKEGVAPCYQVQGEAVTWEGLGCPGYRLPTEAEWEYAARAGAVSEYAGGEQIDEVAWYDRNAGKQTQPVGLKAANAWLLKDMSGNVWEWVWDWYTENYKGAGRRDPIGPDSGSRRVVRGGAWNYDAEYARVADRFGNEPGDRDNNVGFRLARSFP